MDLGSENQYSVQESTVVMTYSSTDCITCSRYLFLKVVPSFVTIPSFENWVLPNADKNGRNNGARVMKLHNAVIVTDQCNN